MSSVSLGVNINALRVQRTLGQATSTLSKSLERLSSGMRINSASDDAAGLAIADRLRANTRLYTGALLNINDAVSAIRIASSAVDAQKGIITRLRELATQSMNGTYSDTQRQAIDNEYRSLLSEFGRIGDATEFNGMDLLRGGRGGALEQILFQVGINGSSTSRLALETGDTGTLSGAFNIADVYSGSIHNSRTNAELNSAANNLVFQTSVQDENGVTRNLAVILSGISQSSANTGSATFYVLQRVSDTGGVGARTGLGIEGYDAVLDTNDDWVLGGGDTLIFDIATGRPIGTDQNLSIVMQFQNRTVEGNFELNLSGVRFQLETNPFLVQFLGYTASDNSPTSSIEFTGVDTNERASAALAVLEHRFLELADLQSRLGAAESRFGSMLRVSQVAREGTQAAESRIRDVDIAAESAQAVRARILQQTAASVLKMASLQPELAVRLLT